MDVAIVKYNAGNIFSVVNALRRLGIEPEITDEAEKLQKADHVLFPGQGNAKTTMAYLREHRLDQLIRDLRQPVLGICVGQQLMCRHSEEGDVDCIGIFPTDVRLFRPETADEKVPAMGWNSLYDLSTPLFEGIKERDYVYFVHSYYVPTCDFTIARADYVQPYSAALHKDNFWAAQFHPEKSGKVGEQLLSNFLNMK
ncbi:MAG: imidazole glycerol phosphate synthase subunit HisH [Prevotella sp.]|nr:imidazole glycerol phosphate synthase subunit HisH [Prevotella sp.]